MNVRWVGWLALLVVALPAGCGGTDSVQDAGSGECARDWDCDDGIFCNGAERCVGGGEAGSGSVCRAATAPCAADRCEESARVCNADCDTADADGDGHNAVSCGGDDCDDTDAVVFPGALEVCDAVAVDEDCDPETVGSLDVDGDGYTALVCCNEDAAGGFRCGDDCDDASAGTNPDVPEVCDGRDNDCNGAIDEGVEVTWYRDLDGDGFGSAVASPGDELALTMTSCQRPDGLLAARHRLRRPAR